GTSADGGRAAETVIVSSVADTEIAATVTVMPGGKEAPVSRTIKVGAHQEERVAVADVLATAEPGVVVEVSGGQASVAHEVQGADDIATEPCARRADRDWYFAGGTTVRGTQQFLALFDPFGDDAVVDVSFLTEGGVQEPDQLQGLVVPRRSRVSVPVHDLVPRQQLVAISVHARTGRVVAERSMLFDGTTPEDAPARRGIALSLGALAPTRTWALPFGTTDDGGTARVGVANFSSTASNVEVEVVLDNDQSLTPVSAAVPARSVISVDVSDRVPPGTHYAVRAFARTVEGHAPPLVVEMLGWWPEESNSTAVASAVGTPRPARRWVVALPDADVDGTVTVLNPGTEAVTAELRVYRPDGNVPASAPAVAIEPGHVATFSLASLGIGRERVVVVVADGDVVAGVTFLGAAGVAVMAAVPDFAFGLPV
ncbi:MAG TPA: DUF5719 family protein, partial [Acidimicrobiia bacterium]|nr:DUF5719 family protein [Acidimicrobiia bacterium]